VHDPMYRFFYTGETSNVTGDIQPPSCDVEGEGSIGITPTSTIYTGAKYFVKYYKLGIQATLTDVYLQVANHMYNINPVSSYKLKINEDTTEYTGSYWYSLLGGTKVLAFENISTSLNGSIGFIFKADEQYTSGNYWAIPVVNYDLDNDGHNAFAGLESFDSGIYYDWSNWYTDLLSPSFIWAYREPIIQFCYQDETDIDISTYYNNWIECYPHTVKTYCEQVAISYTINNTALGYSKLLYIEKDGIVVSGYPIQLFTPTKTIYYVPTSEGSYTVNLSINGVNVTSDTFTASGTCDSYIYTEPNPSRPNKDFNIHYKYNYTEYVGRIKITDMKGQIISGKLWQINKQSDDTKATSLYETGVYEVSLNIYYLNSTDVEVDSNIHTVSMDRIPTIDFTKNPMLTGESNRFYGKHNHLGQDVRIKVGNEYLSTGVGNTDVFEVVEKIYTIGEHTVQLVLVTEDTNIVLATSPNKLRVTGEETTGKEILPSVSTEIGAILGVIVTFGFLMLPFFLQLGRGKSIKVPSVVYAMSGGLGITLSIAFGFFEMWVAFFLIVIGVLIIAGIYIKSTFLGGS